MIPLADSQIEKIIYICAHTSPNYISPLLVLKHGKYKQFISSKSYCLFLLLLVLNFIKELEGSNTLVPLALQHHCHICRIIIQLNDLCKVPNKSCFNLLNHNNGLAQKTHCAALCSIANKNSLDGFFQNTLDALSHAHSINDYCLELDNVIRDNKHAAAMMLDTKSTISRGSKSKNFTIKG